MEKPTPYDGILPRVGLPEAYWWLDSDDGSLYLRRQWACVGIVYPDGSWRLQAWDVLERRQAASKRQAARFLAKVVFLLGENGGRGRRTGFKPRS